VIIEKGNFELDKMEIPKNNDTETTQEFSETYASSRRGPQDEDNSSSLFVTSLGDGTLNDSLKGASDVLYSRTGLRSSSLRPERFRSSIRKELVERHGDIRRNSGLQQLTINELHFDGIRLVGRDCEVKILRSCLERLTSSTDDERVRKELVFIKGYSGVGKSTLAIGNDEWNLCKRKVQFQ
jgi:hypothetical protein